jgi:hypothetical protein
MAKFILLNTTRSKGAYGPKKWLAGVVVDSAQVQTSIITSAGGVLVAATDASVLAASAVAQFRAKQGANEKELDSIMLGSGLVQLGIT